MSVQGLAECPVECDPGIDGYLSMMDCQTFGNACFTPSDESRRSVCENVETNVTSDGAARAACGSAARGDDAGALGSWSASALTGGAGRAHDECEERAQGVLGQCCNDAFGFTRRGCHRGQKAARSHRTQRRKAFRRRRASTLEESRLSAAATLGSELDGVRFSSSSTQSLNAQLASLHGAVGWAARHVHCVSFGYVAVAHPNWWPEAPAIVPASSLDSRALIYDQRGSWVLAQMAYEQQALHLVACSPREVREARAAAELEFEEAWTAYRRRQGSWTLPPRVLTWPAAEHSCIQRCLRCERCRYVSFSLRYRDCSWYASCDLGRLRSRPPGFRTIQVSRRAVNGSATRLARRRRASGTTRRGGRRRAPRTPLRHRTARVAPW